MRGRGLRFFIYNRLPGDAMLLLGKPHFQGLESRLRPDRNAHQTESCCILPCLYAFAHALPSARNALPSYLFMTF